MFKSSFKYYKSKNPPPNLGDVLDLENSEKLLKKSKIRLRNLDNYTTNDSKQLYGLKSCSDWEVFEIVGKPGLLFIKNPFNPIAHRYWSVRCLQDYSQKPNKTNLDSLNVLSSDSDWWVESQNDSALLKKLRWVTLGYHHDWDTKVYHEANRNEFPTDLKELCSFIASRLGFVNFNAEAAIVNFYHMDSTLSGHTDHSEENLEAPLLSFSFGQTAIFLLGGPTIETEPAAIFLRSGDIVIMSKESRLCYHGVPKILPAKSEYWNWKDDSENFEFNRDISDICKSEELFKAFNDYITQSRININVRQVLHRGQKRLISESLAGA